MYFKCNTEPCCLPRQVHLIKDIIFQQHNTAEDHVYISKPQMLKILNAPELPASLATQVMPYALMNGPKQPCIKFKVSDEDVVQERVMFETRIRYGVELGQGADPYRAACRSSLYTSLHAPLRLNGTCRHLSAPLYLTCVKSPVAMQHPRD